MLPTLSFNRKNAPRQFIRGRRAFAFFGKIAASKVERSRAHRNLRRRAKRSQSKRRDRFVDVHRVVSHAKREVLSRRLEPFQLTREFGAFRLCRPVAVMV